MKVVLLKKNQISPEKWNKIITSFKNATLYQSYQWGELKRNKKRNIKRFIVKNNKKVICAAQIEEINLPFSYKILYAERGPLGIYHSKEGVYAFSLLLKKIRSYAQKNKALCLRINPELENTKQNREILKQQKLKPIYSPSFGYLYRATFIVDLSQPIDVLFSNLRNRYRTYIRKAKRKKIEVQSGIQEKDFNVFYSLLQSTAKRNNYSFPPYKNIKKTWKTLKNNGMAKIFLAKFKGIPLCSILVTKFGKECKFKWGGAFYNHPVFKKTHPNCLLHWTAMKWGKMHNCTKYDLSGVTKNIDIKNIDKNCPGWGMFQFKKGFGGKYIRTVGEYDLVFRPFIYNFFRTIIFVHRKIKK